jgi:hypothetical protein
MFYQIREVWEDLQVGALEQPGLQVHPMAMRKQEKKGYDCSSYKIKQGVVRAINPVIEGKDAFLKEVKGKHCIGAWRGI